MGEAFYDAGPCPAQARVGRLFSELSRHGLPSVPEDEVPIITDLFLAMLKADIHTRALLNMPPSGRSLTAIAYGAVDLIMARYGVK